MTKAICVLTVGLLAGAKVLAPITAAIPKRFANADPALRQALERNTYAVNPAGSQWTSNNRVQRLNIVFDGEGARLRARHTSLAFRLASYGYGGDLRKPGRAFVVEDANRLEYRRPELTEWYVNGDKGLEQGFTFQKPPAGRPVGPLTVSLNLSGDLKPRLSRDGVVLEGSGSTSLRYTGLKAIDANGRTLPSRMEVHENQIRLLVEDADARYPVIIDPTWTTQILQPATSVETGHSAAMSGSIAVVGDPGYGSYTGAAYVYTYSGSTWSLQATLQPSDGVNGDGFGWSVAISGSMVVVGAVSHNNSIGAAYVFTQNGSSWTQQSELNPADGVGGEFGGDQFGQAVAISGTTVIVGSPYHAVGSAFDQGAAYIFTQSGSTWTQQAELTSADGATGDRFGWSVAVDGTTALAGAPYRETDLGAAYIFTGSGSTWTQQAELTASDGAQYSVYGWSVVLSGTTALVGAPDASAGGHVYEYSGSGSSWTQQNELTESVSEGSGMEDQFGYSIAISGPYIIVGADQYWYEDEYQPGRVYVYQGSTEVANLKSESSDNNYDEYGYSVGGASGLVIAGVPGKSGGGAAIISSTPASLSISATHATPVFQSGPVNLSLALTNTGAGTAAVATVSDTVPSDLAINTAPGCSVSSQTVTCTVAAGAIGTNTFNVYTTASATAASLVSNTATLSDSTDTLSTDSSSDTITIGSQAPTADSHMSQSSISGSTNGGLCADGNNTLTATVQLENTSGSTMTNPYAVNVSLSGGNTLISNTSDTATVAASGTITFTFDIQLASCNKFNLAFDVRSN